MAEAKELTPAPTIYEIISEYLGDSLVTKHESFLKDLKSEDITDGLVTRGAKILRDSRKREIKRRLDSLTGLPDAKLCREVIETALSEGKKVAVEFCDLLFLKVFNDQIGHERTNEEVFRPIARIYHRAMKSYYEQRKKVIIGRYAGDTFLIVVIGEEKEEAKRTCDQINRNCQKLDKPEGALFRPRFSRGFVFSEEVEEPAFSGIIEAADKKAEKAKKEFIRRLEKRAKANPKGRSAALLKKIRRYG